MATILEEMGPFRCFAHDVLGWHKPNKMITRLGVNNVSYCRYCDKRILQDSQGGWFPSNEIPADKPHAASSEEKK